MPTRKSGGIKKRSKRSRSAQYPARTSANGQRAYEIEQSSGSIFSLSGPMLGGFEVTAPQCQTPSNGVNHTVRAASRNSPELVVRQQTSLGSYHNAVYFGNWRTDTYHDPRSINFESVTRVYYSHASLQADGTLTLGPENPELVCSSDPSQGSLRWLVQQKSTMPNLSILLSVGGEGRGSQTLAQVAKSKVAIENLACCVKSLVTSYELDGIDLYWDEPSYDAADKLFALFDLLRQHLPVGKHSLTCTLPGRDKDQMERMNPARLSQLVDTFNVICYDYFGHWSRCTGHQSQMLSPTPSFSHPEDQGLAMGGCVQSTIGYLRRTCRIHASKLLVGVPAFAYFWPGYHGRGFDTQDPDHKRPPMDYKEVADMSEQVRWDDAAHAVFSTSREHGFMTFDNPDSVRFKANYVVQNQLGGLFYMTVQQDSSVPEKSLVWAGYQALQSPSNAF